MSSKRCVEPFQQYHDSPENRKEAAAALSEDLNGRPSHEIETYVANGRNQHIFSAQMSLAEIIEELPKLTPEERRTIYQQIERLDGEPNFEPTSEMLGLDLD